MSATTFLVRIRCAKSAWDERLPRPVTGVVVLRAIEKKLGLKGLSHFETGDYGGEVSAGPKRVASYVIVPGSEQPAGKKR